jgi:hypothetical protein
METRRSFTGHYPNTADLLQLMHHYPAYVATVASESALPSACASASPLPIAISFPPSGAEVSGFRLTLYAPHELKAGSPVPTVLRLQTTRSPEIALLSDDNPSGVDYDFILTRADGKPVLPRPEYTKMITRISRETISEECPSLMMVALDKRYDLVPGKYSIQAVRRLSEAIVTNDNLTSRDLATITSNTVELIVD